MNINDIFLKRKKRWGTINRLRDSEEQADGSLTPSRRIALISDDKSFRELYAQVKTGNPNSFPGYEKKVEANRLKTGQQDAVVTGTCNEKKTATYNICCKRWSENAGRPFLAYADGKDNSGN